ncbi:MAG: hypothetical protein MJ252_15965 [archaeon]|nr:hypothetical protein [archaeon]
MKLVICGPCKVGKTVIANSLSEFSHVVSHDYHPTRGVRILEMDKNFTGELGKKVAKAKKGNASNLNIELWDMSGDKKFQSIWPALKYGAHGVIIVIDAVSVRYESVLDEWLNTFCGDYDKKRISCFSYRKDDAKKEVKGKKTCNQLPSLPIYEVKNDMSVLLPAFNSVINQLLEEKDAEL